MEDILLGHDTWKHEHETSELRVYGKGHSCSRVGYEIKKKNFFLSYSLRRLFRLHSKENKRNFLPSRKISVYT